MNETTVIAPEYMPAEGRMQGGRALAGIARFVRRNPVGAAGGAILVVMLCMALLAPWIATHGYAETNTRERLQGASTEHLLGTDNLGRDVFSRIVYGARISLTVGFGAMAVSIICGTALGIFCAYRGGIIDLVGQRLIDVFLAMPSLVVAICIVAVFRGGILSLIAVIGFLEMMRTIRIVRGNTLALRNELYVEGARVVGAHGWRIMLRHLLPNVMPAVIILATIQVGGAILAETSLSFLGFGVPPPFPSWGAMLNTSSRNHMLAAPMLSVWPGIAITLVVFAFNMFGDALRDVLDPRLRGTR